MKLTSKAQSSESAQQRLMRSRELCAEVQTLSRDFHDWIVTRLESSSPGSHDAPLYSSSPSDSQT